MIQSIIADHFQQVGRGCFWDDRTWQTMYHITRCRTAACGHRVERCAGCGGHQVLANSCRDRHCPICQGAARAAWVAAREDDLLEVPYFHVVLTMSHDLFDVVRWAPAAVYNALHRASRMAIMGLLQEPRVLGVQGGAIAVLHTWTSDLRLHPHIHLIVPGGGIDIQSGEWRDARISRKKKRPFLMPVARLRQRFTACFLRELRRLYADGVLHAEGDERGYAIPDSCADPVSFHGYLKASRAKPWVVYVKRPFASPRVLVRYLGRYTHRTAISPRRITAYDGKQVTFLARDRVGHGMVSRTLPAGDFVRRFSLHILPRGFHRIRHMGFLANVCRSRKIGVIRDQLARQGRTGAIDGAAVERRHGPKSPAACPQDSSLNTTKGRRCPDCGGELVVIVIRLPGGMILRPDSRREAPASCEVAPKEGPG